MNKSDRVLQIKAGSFFFHHFISFIYYFFFCFIILLGVYQYSCHSICSWRSEDNQWESVLFIHWGDFRDRTRVIWLGFCPLRYLASPSLFFDHQTSTLLLPLDHKKLQISPRKIWKSILMTLKRYLPSTFLGKNNNKHMIMNKASNLL